MDRALADAHAGIRERCTDGGEAVALIVQAMDLELKGARLAVAASWWTWRFESCGAAEVHDGHC
jgi:hypothetical protein